MKIPSIGNSSACDENRTGMMDGRISSGFLFCDGKVCREGLNHEQAQEDGEKQGIGPEAAQKGKEEKRAKEGAACGGQAQIAIGRLGGFRAGAASLYHSNRMTSYGDQIFFGHFHSLFRA
jgi:hypothetical protein